MRSIVKVTYRRYWACKSRRESSGTLLTARNAHCLSSPRCRHPSTDQTRRRLSSRQTISWGRLDAAGERAHASAAMSEGTLLCGHTALGDPACTSRVVGRKARRRVQRSTREWCASSRRRLGVQDQIVVCSWAVTGSRAGSSICQSDGHPSQRIPPQDGEREDVQCARAAARARGHPRPNSPSEYP